MGNELAQQDAQSLKRFAGLSGNSTNSQFRDNSSSTASETSEGSQDDQNLNAKYVMYTHCEQSSPFCLPDIDLMDLPLHASSLSILNCHIQSSNMQTKLPIKKHHQCRLIHKQCCFCQGKLQNGQQIVELPCKHTIHHSCVKKWNIITKPCRLCNQ